MTSHYQFDAPGHSPLETQALSHQHEEYILLQVRFNNLTVLFPRVVGHYP